MMRLYGGDLEDGSYPCLKVDTLGAQVSSQQAASFYLSDYQQLNFSERLNALPVKSVSESQCAVTSLSRTCDGNL